MVQKLRNVYFRELIALAIIVPSSSGAMASIVVSHNGSTDPTSEGWTLLLGVNTVVGAVANDRGTGISARFTDDNSTTSGVGYEHLVTAAEASEAFDNGWKYTARLRVVDSPLASGVVGFSFLDAATDRAYGLSLAGNEGNPAITLSVSNASGGAVSFPSPATGDDYHVYELEYDPGADSLSLTVDGIDASFGIVGGGYDTYLGATSKVFFGSGDSTTMGQGNWALTSFEIAEAPAEVPETASFIVWGLLGLCAALFGYSRRSRPNAAP
jgi:hypothetical protein